MLYLSGVWYNKVMKENTEHIVSLIKAGKSKGFRLAIDVYWAQIRAFALDIGYDRQ